LNKRINFCGKRRAFGRGNPFQPQAALIDSQQTEHLPGFFNNRPASDITFQVMAISDMSTGHQHTIRPSQKRLEQEAVIHPACAHQPDQADIGRILHAGDPCQVSPGIRAPVADKSQYLRFFGSHKKLKIESLCSVYFKSIEFHKSSIFSLQYLCSFLYHPLNLFILEMG
jgi:hypothetical protein